MESPCPRRTPLARSQWEILQAKLRWFWAQQHSRQQPVRETTVRPHSIRIAPPSLTSSAMATAPPPQVIAMKEAGRRRLRPTPPPTLERLAAALTETKMRL